MNSSPHFFFPRRRGKNEKRLPKNPLYFRALITASQIHPSLLSGWKKGINRVP
jgi:hypothetical protein